MNSAKLLILSILCVVIACAQDGTYDSTTVIVYVQNSISTDHLARISGLAHLKASDMFCQAGVRIVWKAGQPRSLDQARFVIVQVLSGTPEHRYAGALAYAREFEGVHIGIFFDRLDNPHNPQATTALLAHVLVHEITHLLQGIDRHSSTGIMKAHWTPHDLAQMIHQPLPFEPVDIELIQKGLRRRATQIPRNSGITVTTNPAAGSTIVRHTSELRSTCIPNVGVKSSSSFTRHLSDLRANAIAS
jgi:hypothetical protein